jgi:hypothetical protein
VRERNLAEPREPCRGRGQSVHFCPGDDEGRVGRISPNVPTTVVALQGRVAGEAAREQHRAHLVEQRRVVECLPARAELALGPVAASRHLHLARGGDDPDDRHLVPGQRPRLVRADRRGRPERLDRGELLHDRLLLRQLLGSESKDDGQHGRQPLGHGGDRERHAEKQNRDDVLARLDVAREENRHHHDRRDDGDGGRERAPDQIHLPLQRCHRLLRPLEEMRDLPHLGRHPGGRDDGAAASARDGGASEDHVHAVGQADRADRGGDVLEHRLALACERCLVGRQRGGLDEPPVGGDRVAFAEHDHVSDDDVARRHLPEETAAYHRRRRRRHPLQRLDRVLGSLLLHVAEQRVGDHDRRDDDRVHRRSLSAFEQPYGQRHRGCREQQIDEWVGEVAEEPAPRWSRVGGVEPVRPEPQQARGGLLLAQPALDVRPERARDAPGVAARGVVCRQKRHRHVRRRSVRSNLPRRHMPLTSVACRVAAVLGGDPPGEHAPADPRAHHQHRHPCGDE